MFEQNKAIWIGLSLLIIAGCGAFLFLSGRSRKPAYNPVPYRGVGEVAARETAKLLNNRGRVVVWIYKATPTTSKLTESALDSFRHALAGNPELVLADVEQLEPPAGLGTIPNIELLGLSPEQFTGLLAKHAQADAVVSFIAPPVLTRDEITRLPQPRPKLIVASLMNAPAMSLVEDGLIQIAIIQKRDAQQSAPPPKTPAEWMDRYYEVIAARSP